VQIRFENIRYLDFSWKSVRVDLAQGTVSACTRNHNTEKWEPNIY